MNNPIAQKAADLLDGGFIERYHIKGQRMITRQSVAEHSWRMVAMLFAMWPDARRELVHATAFLDVSERVTGDMPANIKRANPEIASAVNFVSTGEEHRLGIRFELTDLEAKVLRWLDRFEGVQHCLDEYNLGNRLVLGTLDRYWTYCTTEDNQITEDDTLRGAQLAMMAPVARQIGNIFPHHNL